MRHYNTIFSQVLNLIPRHQFETIVKRHKADRYVKYFSCWQQFITLLFAQIRAKDSLVSIKNQIKDIENKYMPGS